MKTSIIHLLGILPLNMVTSALLFSRVSVEDNCASEMKLAAASRQLIGGDFGRMMCASRCHATAGCASFGWLAEPATSSSVCQLYTSAIGADVSNNDTTRPAAHYGTQSDPGLPATYSLCNGTAYRVLPWHGRAEVMAACAADGGRMAVPLTLTQRRHVAQLMKQAVATPGFNDARPVDNPHLAYVGIELFDMVTTLYATDGSAVTVPADAWESGEPNDNRQKAWIVLNSNGAQFLDWHYWGYLMSVCEIRVY